jgi:hypothetical protein
MSADNGIYILPSPNGDSLEYRVAHCQAIENIDYDPMYEVLLFSKSPVYTSQQEAAAVAIEMSKSYDILEYGVALLEDRKQPFLNQSYKEAEEILFK